MYGWTTSYMSYALLHLKDAIAQNRSVLLFGFSQLSAHSLSDNPNRTVKL